MAEIYHAAEQVLVWLGDTHVTDPSVRRHAKWMACLVQMEESSNESVVARFVISLVKGFEIFQEVRACILAGAPRKILSRIGIHECGYTKSICTPDAYAGAWARYAHNAAQSHCGTASTRPCQKNVRTKIESIC